ncbi:hypothetical protein [Staphylococcus petrasii]|uniref:hypothetical protein n=1 Tax=Staphylococcus petrasii TaxID=1276936 RepID=UPI003F672E58
MSFLGFLIFVGLSILFYKKTKLSILQSMGISIILSALVNFILNMLIFINFSILVILALMIVGAVYYIYKKTLSDWKKINPTK